MIEAKRKEIDLVRDYAYYSIASGCYYLLPRISGRAMRDYVRIPENVVDTITHSSTFDDALYHLLHITLELDALESLVVCLN